MHPVMAMVVLSDPIALSSLKYGVVGLVWLFILWKRLRVA